MRMKPGHERPRRLHHEVAGKREEGTGKLTWRVTAPASGKVKLAFVYELKRPKGYKVHQ